MVRGWFGWEQSQAFFLERAMFFFFEENGVKPGDHVSRSHCWGLDFATITRGAEMRDHWSRRKYGVLSAEFASFYLLILSHLEKTCQ